MSEPPPPADANDFTPEPDPAPGNAPGNATANTGAEAEDYAGGGGDALDLSDVHPAALDDAGRVAVELPCRACGYDLRMLHAGADCPECGQTVYFSLVGDLLRFGDADWLSTVARGALWSLNIVVAAFLVGLLFGAFGMAVEMSAGMGGGTGGGGGAWGEFWLLVFTVVIGLFGGLLNGLATLWITAPEPATALNPEPDDRLRHWSRVLILISIAVGLLSVPLEVADYVVDDVMTTTVTVSPTINPTPTPPAPNPTPMTPGQPPAPIISTPPTPTSINSYSYDEATTLGTAWAWVAGIFQVVGFAGLLVLARYLRRLALRAPATGLATQTLIVFWGWIGMIGVFGVVCLLFIFVQEDWMFQSGGFPTVPIVLSCGAGVLFLALGVWSLVLYLLYYLMLKRHAGYARNVEAARASRGARAHPGPEPAGF